MIEPATEKDAPQVAECLVTLNKGFVKHFNEKEALRYIREYNVAVSKEDGIVQGVVVFRDSGFDVSIEAIAIHPDYQRQGIGKALIDSVEKAAKIYKFKTMKALSYAFYNAKPFYEKLGFTTKDSGKYDYLFIKEIT